MATKSVPAVAVPFRSAPVTQPVTATKPKAPVVVSAPAVAGKKAPAPAKPPVALPKV